MSISYFLCNSENFFSTVNVNNNNNNNNNDNNNNNNILRFSQVHCDIIVTTNSLHSTIIHRNNAVSPKKKTKQKQTNNSKRIGCTSNKDLVQS